MPGGNAGIAGEVELAEAAALAPLPYQAADWGAIKHAASLARPLQRSNYPAGNGRAPPPGLQRPWFEPADGDKRVAQAYMLCGTAWERRR